MRKLAATLCMTLGLAMAGACVSSGPAFRINEAETPFGKEVGATLYLDQSRWTAVDFIHRGGGYQLGVMFAQNGASAERIDAGSTLVVALAGADGVFQQVPLLIQSEIAPVASRNGSSVMTQWYVSVPLDATTVEMFGRMRVGGAELPRMRVVLDKDQSNQFLYGVQQVVGKATKLPATSTAIRNTRSHGNN